MGPLGFGPRTSRLSAGCSTRLSYEPLGWAADRGVVHKRSGDGIGLSARLKSRWGIAFSWVRRFTSMTHWHVEGPPRMGSEWPQKLRGALIAKCNDGSGDNLLIFN